MISHAPALADFFLLGWPVSSTGLKFDVVFSFRIIKKNFYNYVQFSRYILRDHVPMGLSGLEPPTSRLSGVRSNLLSYKPPRPIRPPYHPTHART